MNVGWCKAWPLKYKTWAGGSTGYFDIWCFNDQEFYMQEISSMDFPQHGEVFYFSGQALNRKRFKVWILIRNWCDLNGGIYDITIAIYEIFHNISCITTTTDSNQYLNERSLRIGRYNTIFSINNFDTIERAC
jgi:hypothetical protein